MVETRKLAAILAADTVGFSRLASADEERTLARLRAHRSDLIDPTIALHREAEAMSDQNRDELSDKEKIDRAAYHEEVRFLKKQQWAVATAGVLLFGALLAAIRDMPTATAL